MDSHTFDGHDETTPDDTDFEYITAILESFTNLKTTQPQENWKINQNLGARKFHHDATPHTCKARQAMKLKFNYKLIIKMSGPPNFSYDSTFGPDAWDGELNNFEPASLNSIKLDGWNQNNAPRKQLVPEKGNQRSFKT